MSIFKSLMDVVHEVTTGKRLPSPSTRHQRVILDISTLRLFCDQIVKVRYRKSQSAIGPAA